MTSYFAPLRAHGAEVLALDMQALFLTGQVLPFGAKLTVNHVFRCSEKSSVEVVYCFPLPRDASLVGFRISGDRFSISSRLERAADAQRRYEEALENGSLAGLTQQSLDGIVNLTVGNLLPGETVSVHLDLIAGLSLTDDGFRFRFPFTVAPCYHQQMRVSLDRSGAGTIELPETVTGGVFLPPFHNDAAHLHKIGFDLRVEPAQNVREIASPSHALRLILNDACSAGVKLSPDQDIPNRDLVLDVKRGPAASEAWSDRASGGRKHFAMVVPSAVFGQQVKTSRKVVFLLDRSGSMQGQPLIQARRTVENCLARLSPDDRFGIVAFDGVAERFRETLLPGTQDHKDEACAFLSAIDARGGTELASGVEAAVQLLGASEGEIFLITDGQVAGTVDILRRARKCEIRLFCLGIGSASQDRFLELLARQTGGVCRFVTPAERVDMAAFELFSALGGTIATEVRITNANMRPFSTGPVFCGTPLVAFGEIDMEDPAAIIEWLQGSTRVPFEPIANGLEGFVEKLHGAKLIADLEACYENHDDAVRQKLVEVSERYGITSSEVSLVAVVERADDENGTVPKTKIVPVGMPQHIQFDLYFGAQAPLFSLGAPTQLSGSLFSMSRKDTLSFEDCLATWKIPAISDPGGRLLPELQAAVPDTKNDLLSSLREAIGIIEDPTGKDAEVRIADVLTRLVAREDPAGSDAQKSALAALIDFLSSDMVDFLDTGHLDFDKWRTVRQQLETAWPEVIDVGTR